MSLLSRMATLVKADAHGMVDAVEDRGLLLRQHLREAEAELQRKKARADALAAEDKDLEEEGKRLRAQAKALDEDISLAMTNGKEDLARFSIRKLLPLRQSAIEAERRLKRVREERETLVARLAQQEQEYEGLKARVRGYLAEASKRAEEGSAPAGTLASDEEVELELLRRKQAAAEGGK